MTPATRGAAKNTGAMQRRAEADVRGPLLRVGRELEHDVQSRYADRRHLNARQGEDGGKDSDGRRDQRQDVRPRRRSTVPAISTSRCPARSARKPKTRLPAIWPARSTLVNVATHQAGASQARRA